MQGMRIDRLSRAAPGEIIGTTAPLRLRSRAGVGAAATVPFPG